MLERKFFWGTYSGVLVATALVVALLPIGACKRTDTEETPEAEKVVEVKGVIDESRVVYHTRFAPNELGGEELAELGDFVERMDLTAEDVWFVRVLWNGKDILTVDIYFWPESASGRIRRGKWVRYNSSSWLSRKEFKGIRGMPEFELPPVDLDEYVQVSLKDAPFGDEIEIPWEAKMVPFRAPEGFSEEEIVEIVDFVRSGPTLKTEPKEGFRPEPRQVYRDPRIDLRHPLDPRGPLSDPNGPEEHDVIMTTTTFQEIDYDVALYREIDLSLPIHKIEREGEIIEVWTGTQEGFLSGSGNSIEIRKGDDGYELVSVGMWLS